MTVAGPRLVVHAGLGRRIVPIPPETALFTIGRQAGHDVQLAGAEVSRDHAEIVVGGGRFLLRDRASRYGTYVNGVRVVERVLEPGDRIECGRTGAALVFLLDNAADAGVERGSTGEFHHVTALLEALRQMGGERVLDEVLALVLDSAIDATGAERGFIMLANAAGTLELKLARQAGHVSLPAGTFETSRKSPDQVFATGEAAVVTDLLDDEMAAVHTGTIALGIRQVLCVPLRVVRYVARADAAGEPRSIGVLYLDSRERGRLLSQPVRTAIEAVAAEAALAIENARLYQQAIEKARLDQELEIVSHIQQALLPQARRIGTHFDVVGAAVPSRLVGGDFFEYQDLPGGHFGIGLGDVTGKGPPAALLAALVQGVLAAEALTSSPPNRVADLVNRVLLARPIDARFLTLFLGELAPDGRFTFCNAGHTPPFVFRESGVQRLERGGTLLGAFDDALFEADAVQLADGDLLVLVSDGVTEAVDAADDQFGDARIERTVTPMRREAPEHILRALLDAIAAFVRDVPQHDDLTAVVLRYRQPA